MKRENWEALIAEQKESGLTISAFCRMRGLNRKTFSYQKSILKAQKPWGAFVQLGAPCTIELTLVNRVTM